MRLKNYNEDLVLETVKIVLNDRKDIKPTRSFLLDVAAYALNRIPPKYITSERGFTRQFIHDPSENGEKLIDVIELITLVNRALDAVSNRRRDGAPSRARRAHPRSRLEDLRLTYFYNIPHIFGRIIDASNARPIVAAQATLFINEKLSVPAESGWVNPYHTNEKTRGYFSFWPQAEMGDSDSLSVELRIGFDHSEYRPFSFHKRLKVQGEFFVHDYIRSDRLLDVGTLALERA